MIELSSVWKRYKKGSFFSKEYKDILKGIDLNIKKGEHLGIIGESGAGKSTLSRIVSLLELPDAGKLSVDGELVTKKNVSKKRGTVGMVFQDPATSLDPKMSVFSTLKEANKNEESIYDVLERVNLKKELLPKYPHQLSGGEQQRVAIARVLLFNSQYVVFDEFTSALDVSTQAKIVNLLCDLNKDRQFGFVFVSHDVNLIGYLSDRVYVLYKGEIVEETNSLKQAIHPYTIMLLNANLKENSEGEPGVGCAFYHYCPNRLTKCKKEKPQLKIVDKSKAVRCFLYD